MKIKNMKIGIFCLFYLLAFNYTYGQFHAVHIPDDLLSSVIIDGDTTDWNWVPEKYFIYGEDLINVAPESQNPNIMNCKVIIGWNDVSNKLYILAHIFDDINITKSPVFWQNDIIQFALCPLNMEGYYGNGSNTFNNVISGRFVDIVSENRKGLQIGHGPKWLINENGHINWRYKKIVHQESPYFEYIYEISMSLWDKWDEFSAQESNRCNLVPNKAFWLNLIINDADTINMRKAEWTFSDDFNWWNRVIDYPRCILDPAICNSISWDGVEYIIED